MDNAKHLYGQTSEEAHAFLDRYDAFISRLINYSDKRKEQGEDVTILITGDHSQKNISYFMYGNEVLEKAGYLKWEGKNHVGSHKAYFQGGGGIAYLYVDEGDEHDKILDECRELFEKNPAVGRIYEKGEAINIGSDPEADLTFEAAEGYSLETDNPESIRKTDEYGIALIEPDGEKATHGYYPEDDKYYTMFLAYGPSVNHIDIDAMSIMDITPSICAHLGLKYDEMDGHEVTGLFK